MAATRMKVANDKVNTTATALKSLVKQPIFIASDNQIFFDVDETLVFWNTNEDPFDDIITIVDPYISGTTIDLVPHDRHISLLKRNKGQGRNIVVWSAGGADWAKTVVYALGIEEYVDVIMAKPTSYVDDTPMEAWGCQRIYLHKHFRKHSIGGH